MDVLHKLTGDNEPGVGKPTHVHYNEYEVFKLIEGEVEFTLGDMIRILRSGDVIYCQYIELQDYGVI